MNEWKNEWMNKWMKEWMNKNEWMNEWMNEWTNEWMNEWMNLFNNDQNFEGKTHNLVAMKESFLKLIKLFWKECFMFQSLMQINELSYHPDLSDQSNYS